VSIFRKILHPEKFNLILYYTITSFVIIAILSVVVGWIFPRMERQELIKRSEEYAQYFINNLNYEIYNDFLFPTLQEEGIVDLENNPEHFKRLDTTIRKNLYGLHIKKLYLFDLKGHIIYSTIPEHIGFVIEQGKNKKLDSAIRGTPASALRLAGTRDSKGVLVTDTMLESYYPFYNMQKTKTSQKQQVGVMEIYQDMSGLKKQVQSARKKAIIMTSAAMGILFLVLFLVVLKAARVLSVRNNQLIDARNTLERKVKVRTQEIRDAYRKLQETQRRLIQSEKLASIGTLVTGLAHEINNPLASVASCAEGLSERLKDIMKERKPSREKESLEVFPEYLKIINEETYRCKSIISNLLDFSRQSEPKFTNLDIHNIILETVSVVRHQFHSKAQQIHLQLPDTPCFVIGDPQQLKQVFFNLLINALHATANRGEITLSTVLKQKNVHIIFKDTGSGIDPVHLDKLFDPFFTTKSTGKGTGLGLAICYGIIDVHNGRIEVESEGPGKGATFTVILPVYT